MRRSFVLTLLGVVILGAGGGVALASSNQAGRHSTSGALASSTRRNPSPAAHRVNASGQARATVSLASSAPDPVPGERVTLRGLVSPSRAGHRILVQRQDASGWKTVARPTVSARSRFSASLVLSKPGRVV